MSNSTAKTVFMAFCIYSVTKLPLVHTSKHGLFKVSDFLHHLAVRIFPAMLDSFSTIALLQYLAGQHCIYRKLQQCEELLSVMLFKLMFSTEKVPLLLAPPKY